MSKFNPIEQFQRNPHSRARAIKAKCAECVGCTADHLEKGFKESISSCTAYLCPLHKFRPYRAKKSLYPKKMRLWESNWWVFKFDMATHVSEFLYILNLILILVLLYRTFLSGGARTILSIPSPQICRYPFVIHSQMISREVSRLWLREMR